MSSFYVGVLTNPLLQQIFPNSLSDTLLVIGFTGCLISLCFEAALSAEYIGTTNHAGLSAGVFFLFLYITL